MNGEERETAAPNITALLQELEAPALGIAVAVNGRVVRRGDHASHQLQDGDEVEFIRAVQGG